MPFSPTSVCQIEQCLQNPKEYTGSNLGQREGTWPFKSEKPHFETKVALWTGSVLLSKLLNFTKSVSSSVKLEWYYNVIKQNNIFQRAWPRDNSE